MKSSLHVYNELILIVWIPASRDDKIVFYPVTKSPLVKGFAMFFNYQTRVIL